MGSFRDWVAKFGEDVFRSITANANSRNPKRWKKLSANLYVWREGQKGEQEYDFSDSFPVGDRPEVDRLEGYLYALYQHRGGEGAFEPFVDEDDD